MSHFPINVFTRLTSISTVAAAIAFSTLAAPANAAPLLEAGEPAASSGAPAKTITELTAADDSFLVWNDVTPAVARPEHVEASDAPAVVGSVEALNAAFDGENPIIPVPPALVVGVIGLIVVGGMAIRREQATATGAKLF